MHAVFLYHAIQAGMDMGIVNAGQLAVYETIDPQLREACEDVVLNRTPEATERMLEIAERYKGAAGKEARKRTSNGATGRLKSGWNMRWSTASPNISRPTRKRRGRMPSARCMSSKAR